MKKIIGTPIHASVFLEFLKLVLKYEEYDQILSIEKIDEKNFIVITDQNEVEE